MSRLNCVKVVSRTTSILLIEGLLPSHNLRKLQIGKLIYHYILYIFMINLLGLNIVNGIRANNAMLVNRMICVLIPVLNLIAKAFTMQRNKNCFKALVEDLNSDAFNAHSNKQNEYIQIVDRISKLLLRYFTLTIALFLSLACLLPIFVNTKILIPNPIPLGKFEIIYKIVHLISTSYFGLNSACFDLLYVSMIGVCIAQLKILEERLINIYEDSNRAFQDRNLEIDKKCPSVSELLRECVILHEVINGFVKKLSVLLSFPLFVQYICGCLVICNVVLQVTVMGETGTTNIITIVAYVSVIIFQMAMYHWFGNEVMFKSDKIIEACYLSKWYNLDNRSRRCLMLLMERAKRPLAIELYKFVLISLESLAVILRWSYSLFALIKARYS